MDKSNAIIIYDSDEEETKSGKKYEPIYVLSIDVGIQNFSYSEFKCDEGHFELVRWKVLATGLSNPYNASKWHKTLHSFLENEFPDYIIPTKNRHVFIERQRAVSYSGSAFYWPIIQNLIVEALLHSFFQEVIDVDARKVSAYFKLNVLGLKGAKGTRAKKREAIQLVSSIFAKMDARGNYDNLQAFQSIDFSSFRSYYESNPKKDDLADSFLQGVYILAHRCVIFAF